MPEKSAILIVDDDEQIRKLLADLLRSKNSCTTAGSGEAALAMMAHTEFSLVISDINMGELSGIDLVSRILEKCPDTVVVMISGQQTIDCAIEAMRAGAYDYITKPLDIRHIEAAVSRALAHHALLVQQRKYEGYLQQLVTERTAEVEHLAYHDGVTDLPNRILFSDRCTQALTRAQSMPGNVAVMLVSLDRFDRVTEGLGHVAGDALLIGAATRLRDCAPESNMVARFEGGEFALLFSDFADPADLTEVSRAIINGFKEPFYLEGQEVYVNTSLGIGLFPFNGEDGSATLGNAAKALYQAKKRGGGNYQFYTREMDPRAGDLALENSIRRAIRNDEFVTYYQPLVSLASRQIVGFEALVRWQHPKHGLLPPNDFIGLAEETGLILDIGDCVLRQACTQTREWQRAGSLGLRISINVSAKQFQQENFLEHLKQVLAQTDLDPACLELELTETSIMENTESSGALLSQLGRMGVRVAIDDFGTGYSSLGYLKNLPIDTVKLDRSFVKGVPDDPRDAALVMAVVTLAQNLNVKVLAEGVETEEQAAFLCLIKCQEAQGFLFGKAQPPEMMHLPKNVRLQNRKEHMVAKASRGNFKKSLRSGQRTG